MAIFRREAKEAFPGDTYIEDLKNSAQTDELWVKMLVPAIAFAAIADWYFMQSTLALAMDWQDLDSLSAPRVSYPSVILTEISALAIIVIYLVVGLAAGKSLKKFVNARGAGNLFAFIVCLMVEVVAIASFTSIRYYGESQDKMADPLVATAMMAIFMALAAFMMIFRSLVSGDREITDIALDAEKHLPEDKELYRRTFAEYAINPVKDRDYERREREIDKRAVDSAFRLSSIASRLNGILDPADAYEFQQAQQMAIHGYYDQGTVKGSGNEST